MCMSNFLFTPVLKDLHCLAAHQEKDCIQDFAFDFLNACKDVPLDPYLRELLVKQANTRTLRFNTKNLLQIPQTNLK